MTKYQQNHSNKATTSDNKMRYRDDRVSGGGYQSTRPGSETRNSQDSTSGHFKPPVGSSRPPYNIAALQRLPPTIDTLPPRLKKKHILDAGLPEELVNKNISEILQQYSSNSMGMMGRNNRNNRFDQPNFSSNYHSKYDNQRTSSNFDGNHNQRSMTPPLASKSHVSRQTATPLKPPTQQQSRYDSSNPVQQRRDENSITKSVQDEAGSGSFDWSEDVLNSQSLPYEVNANHSNYDDSNRPRHRRRNRR